MSKKEKESKQIVIELQDQYKGGHKGGGCYKEERSSDLLPDGVSEEE